MVKLPTMAWWIKWQFFNGSKKIAFNLEEIHRGLLWLAMELERRASNISLIHLLLCRVRISISRPDSSGVIVRARTPNVFTVHSYHKIESDHVSLNLLLFFSWSSNAILVLVSWIQFWPNLAILNFHFFVGDNEKRILLIVVTISLQSQTFWNKLHSKIQDIGIL